MMVVASALHECQVHDLDKPRTENEEMRKSIDGHFTTPNPESGPQRNSWTVPQSLTTPPRGCETSSPVTSGACTG